MGSYYIHYPKLYYTLEKQNKTFLNLLFIKGDTLRVVGVIGPKNSGKTTLICDVLKVLREKNIKVAVVKHSGILSRWTGRGQTPIYLRSTPI